MSGRLLKLRLRVHKGTTSLWQADTLFGLWCMGLAEREGETMLDFFLEECREGNPPVVFSDPFPGDTLPRPDFPFRRAALEEEERAKQLQEARVGKHVKSLRYLPTAVGMDLLRGRNPDLSLVSGEGFEPFASEHVTMERLNDRALDGGLFTLTEYRPHAGFLTVYARVAQDWDELFEDVTNYVIAQGVGGKRSIGRGRMTIEACEEALGFPDAGSANAFVSLSSFVPAASDPVQGWYRVRVKRGVAGPALGGVSPFKRPVIYLEPGATFRVEGAFKPVYGRLLAGVLSSNRRVVQSGFALAVPVVIP